AAALTPKISANAGSPSGHAFDELVLAEKLGIDHPDQVVDFDYSTDTSPFYVTAPDGAVTQYQRLAGGKLALRLRGGLRANEVRRFRIVPGFAPSEPADDADSVRVVETAAHYEIANALVAVRVPRAILPGNALPPIQAVRLRDKTCAGAETGGSPITDLAGKPLGVEDMRVAFLERGPLMVTVEAMATWSTRRARGTRHCVFELRVHIIQHPIA